MSNQNANSDLSLAMVDVITNGLAATFVLFFIMVVLQEQLVWSESAPAAATGNLTSEEPLVMHVTTNDGSPLLPPDSASPWQLKPAWKKAQLETGHNFAVLYAPMEPPQSTSIQLKLPPQHPACEIQVMHGLKRQTWSVARDAAAPSSVWPLTEKPAR